MKSAAFATTVVGASAHGAMTHPKPRNAFSSPGVAPSHGSDLSCLGDSCYWYQVGCQIGCPTCQLNLDHKGCGGENCCSVSDGLMEPTNNDPEFRTYWSTDDNKKYNPWRAPGKAPIADPCGIASGGLNPNAYAAVPQGYSAGAKGSEVLPEQEATLWQAGATAQVGWGLSAQHSGGYSYRLCPKNSAMTEECFQSNVLTFASANSTIHWNDGSREDKQIGARTYVAPDGAQWRTNPIPACGDASHGSPTPNCPSGTMFEPGFEDFTQGYLVGDKNRFSVMDEVNVPNTPGEYMLSWRWDCESADQVWNSCADIVITADPVPAPTPAPTPADGTCPHFTPGVDSCPDTGCMTRDASGDCVECCEGCWWMYSTEGSICRNGRKPHPTPTPSPSPKPPSPSPSPDQCASRHTEKQFDCYYEGCKAGDMKAGACTECCDGCHLESDPTKGSYCMEDKAEFV